MTWCAGRELDLNGGPKVEADFIVWYQRRGITRDDQSSVTDIVFGEAKSFGRDSFRTKDVTNLKAIAQRFPGSVLVFATMRQPGDMSTDEIRAIRTLALWGREPIERRCGHVRPSWCSLALNCSRDSRWKRRGESVVDVTQRWLMPRGRELTI